MSYLDVSTSHVVFHAWGTEEENSLASDSLHLLSDAVDAGPVEFRLAQDKARRVLLGVNGNYILEEGYDLFKNIEPPFTASQFMQSFNQGSETGMHPLLLWQTRWSHFFQNFDEAFETSVKSRLSKDEWSVLVACQMGIEGYRFLRGNHLLEADVSEWSIAPTLRVEPCSICSREGLSCENTVYASRGPCRACSISGESCRPFSSADRDYLRLSAHVELLLASDSIFRDTIRVSRENRVAYTEEVNRSVVSGLCNELERIRATMEEIRNDFL